jgi:hypothetical protein
LAEADTRFSLTANILKMDEEQHIVYGWASVVEENGQPVVDSQGDIISISDLTKAAHEFIMHYRTGKTMHVGEATGVIVESMVFSKDIQDALGINLDKQGWFIGYKVLDDAIWDMVKNGTLKAFSIGGMGRRIAI